MKLFAACLLLVPTFASLASAADEAKAVSLFDGKSLAGWVTGAGKPVTAGWAVTDGTLHRADKGGDIYTEKEYFNFVLEFEWKIAEGGNSGLKYRFGKYGNQNIGPEYQLLDDEKHADAKIGRRRQTASLYDVIEPNSECKPSAIGQWNQAKIVCKGSKIEHWLNGKKVVDIDMESEEYKAGLKTSKFKKSPDFGTKPGKIMLQDHGDKVWFRKISITELAEKAAT